MFADQFLNAALVFVGLLVVVWASVWVGANAWFAAKRWHLQKSLKQMEKEERNLS